MYRCTAHHIIQHIVLLYHSKLSLYGTSHHSAESDTEAQKTFAVLHTTLFSRLCNYTTVIYRYKAHHIIPQRVTLKHRILSLYCTPHYSADCATLPQQFIAVLHTTLFSRLCYSTTAIYRCTAHHIILQTVLLYHSNLSLYNTPHHSAESDTEAQKYFAVLHTTLFSRQFHITQKCIAVLHTTLFSRQCHITQKSIAVLHTTLFSRQCHCNTEIYRCTARQIIQQTMPL